VERARCDMLCQYAAASAPSISPEEGLLSLCFISHHIFQRSDITALEGCSDVRHGLAGEMRLIPAPCSLRTNTNSGFRSNSEEYKSSVHKTTN
jgi:hypothetical protein